MGHSLLTFELSNKQEAYLGVTGNSLSKGLKVNQNHKAGRSKVSVAGPAPAVKAVSVLVVEEVGVGCV